MDRKLYIDKMAAKLREWDDDILKFENKVDKIKNDTSSKYHEQLEELKHRREQARQKLDHLRQNSGEAWEELKEGMENSWNSLEISIRKAWGILRD